MKRNLRGLHTFCTVARLLSFKKSADELFLTPSAISHQISELETQLGAKLFERTTRSILLTREGLGLFNKILPHIEAIDGATNELISAGSKNYLHVQLPEFFASEILMPAITEFNTQHKNIDLQIEATEIAGDENPKADVTVTLSSYPPEAKHFAALFPIRYVPACSKYFFQVKKDAVKSPLELIKSSTLIVHSARQNIWERWKEHANLTKIEPEKVIYLDSMFAMARAAESGVGIAMIPLPISQAWLENDFLIPLHHKQLITKDFYWVSINDCSSKTEASKIFLTWLVSKLKAVT